MLLFLQKSYRDVTMKELVEKTGLSKGAFYHYFSSKEELFKEIVMMFFQMGRMDYSAYPRDSLYEFYHKYIRDIGESFGRIDEMTATEEKAQSMNFFFLMFEAVSRFPEFLKMEQEMYETEIGEWELVIDRAKKTGEINSDSSARQLADLFLYCTDGVFIRFVNQKKGASYPRKLNQAFDTVYNNLKMTKNERSN